MIYKKLLSDFSYISVREKSAKKIINFMLPDKNVVISADPTLLFTKDDWLKLLENYKNHYGRFILVYELISSDSLLEYALKKAEEKKCAVLRIAPQSKKKVKNVRNLYGISPIEFIGLIANAEMVCTNSFHGTAFSLNFNKNIHIELLKEPYTKLNARLTDLLEDCGIVCGSSEIEVRSFDNKFIEQQRKNGIEYLKEMLEKQI